MAKIKRMPSQAIIDGFKKTLDFYEHNGVACVRRWPRSPGHHRTPEVEQGWGPFAYASREWNNLSPYIQETYNRMAQDTALTGRDWFTRSYISGIYRYPTGEPED